VSECFCGVNLPESKSVDLNSISTPSVSQSVVTAIHCKIELVRLTFFFKKACKQIALKKKKSKVKKECGAGKCLVHLHRSSLTKK